MDSEKLKLIIRNIDLLLDALKSEVYSEPEAYTKDYSQITDYDEVFIDDDDGHPD